MQSLVKSARSVSLANWTSVGGTRSLMAPASEAAKMRNPMRCGCATKHQHMAIAFGAAHSPGWQRCMFMSLSVSESSCISKGAEKLKKIS